jgi:hypothetical protein
MIAKSVQKSKAVGVQFRSGKCRISVPGTIRTGQSLALRRHYLRFGLGQCNGFDLHLLLANPVAWATFSVIFFASPPGANLMAVVSE